MFNTHFVFYRYLYYVRNLIKKILNEEIENNSGVSVGDIYSHTVSKLLLRIVSIRCDREPGEIVHYSIWGNITIQSNGCRVFYEKSFDDGDTWASSSDDRLPYVTDIEWIKFILNKGHWKLEQKYVNFFDGLYEQDNNLEWAEDLISQLRYHESKNSKGYLNAENNRMGQWEIYYDSGNLHMKGDFINSKRVGIWEIYHQNGKLHYTGEFINDRMNGEWIYYHDNGNMSAKGEFKDGEMIGRWAFYTKDGTLYTTTTY